MVVWYGNFFNVRVFQIASRLVKYHDVHASRRWGDLRYQSNNEPRQRRLTSRRALPGWRWLESDAVVESDEGDLNIFIFIFFKFIFLFINFYIYMYIYIYICISLYIYISIDIIFIFLFIYICIYIYIFICCFSIILCNIHIILNHITSYYILTSRPTTPNSSLRRPSKLMPEPQ